MAPGTAFDLGPVYPYVELRAVFDLITIQVKLRTDTYGFVGSTNYLAGSFMLGPRAGVFVPLGDTFFIDFSGWAGLFGAEHATFCAGLGIWAGHRMPRPADRSVSAQGARPRE